MATGSFVDRCGFELRKGWAGDVDASFAFLRHPSRGRNSREKRPRDRNAYTTQGLSAVYGFHG
jgi:hypothetical protein